MAATQPQEFVMTTNVGGIDRILRIVVGIAVLALFFVLEGNARYWALVGLVPLFTGLFRTCPLYSVIGVNTCPMKQGG
jgi:hypothetical protein